MVRLKQHAVQAIQSTSTTRTPGPVIYEFIPADNKFLQNEGVCVFGQIDRIYGNLHNHLSTYMFVGDAHVLNTQGRISLHFGETSVINSGVRTSTLNRLRLWPSTWMFFSEYDKSTRISTFGFYLVNSRLYWVNAKEQLYHWSERAADLDTTL